MKLVSPDTNNATFDFGFFAAFLQNLYALKAAITSGEERNSLNSNSGLAFTGRIELPPFGWLTGDNDYIEGHLKREKTPKLSLAKRR